MKIEFYVEGIYYHPENPTPSVIIMIRNNVKSLSPPIPVFVDKHDDMKKVLRDVFADSVKIHKTSFVVGLDDYRKSGISVGDKLEVEMKVNNNGEIKQ